MENATPARIRRARAGDRDAIGRLGALMVETHHDFDPLRFLPATAETAKHYGAFLSRQVDDPDSVLLVAEDASGTVIGYAYAALEGYDYMALRGPGGVLHDLIVDPARRGGGVGRQLLRAALEALRERGARQVVLSTAVQNEGAQRLFASEGFRATMVEMTRELEEGEPRG